MVYLFYYESGSPIYAYGETFDDVFGKVYDKSDWTSFHKLNDFPNEFPLPVNFTNIVPLQLGRSEESRVTMKVFEVTYADKDENIVSFLIAGQRNLVESYLSANQTHKFQIRDRVITLELVGCTYSHDVEFRY